MTELYNLVLYQPIFNLLVFLYNITPGNDIGVAIILLTIIIKVILFPLSKKLLRSQSELQRIQPLVAEIQKKYKDQKEKLSQELLALYKREKINPFSSCFPLLIQLPFLIAVFHVFRKGLASPESLNILYPFIQNPGMLNPVSFGLIDLSKTSIVFAIFAGAAQFWQSKMLVTKKPPVDVPGSKDEGMTAIMNKQMLYFMPLITVFIGSRLPAGLTFYWFLTTLFTVAQQYFIFKKDKSGNPQGNNQKTESEGAR